MFLLPLLEVEAVSDEYTYADRIFGQAALWLRSSPYVPALLALGFATSFIHYVLDRAAFRFSSPDVRQAARGLLSEDISPLSVRMAHPLERLRWQCRRPSHH